MIKTIMLTHFNKTNKYIICFTYQKLDQAKIIIIFTIKQIHRIYYHLFLSLSVCVREKIQL